MPKVYTPTDDLLEQIEDGMFTFCLKLCTIAVFGHIMWDTLKMVFPRLEATIDKILDATRVEIDKILDARKVEVENLNSPSPLILDEAWLRKGFDQLSDQLNGDRACRRLDDMEVEIQNLKRLVESRWVRRRHGRRH